MLSGLFIGINIRSGLSLSLSLIAGVSFKEMFFPSDPLWEQMVKDHNQAVLPQAIENFSKSGKK